MRTCLYSHVYLMTLSKQSMLAVLLPSCFISTSARLLHYSPETTLAKVTKGLLTATFNGYINLWHCMLPP